MYIYISYNLIFRIPFKCINLIKSNNFDHIDVNVNYGNVPRSLELILNEGPIFEANNNQFLLKIIDVGRFLVQNGNEIIIEPSPKALEEDIRIFLLSSAMAALLNQRGLFVIHASSVVSENGAIVFAGKSGVGKSTTTQAFLQKNYKKLSDDIVALYYDEILDEVMVLPSYPYSKLWQKSADLLETETNNLPRVRKDINKFVLCTKDKFHNKPTKLHAIYELMKRNELDSVELEEKNEIEKMKILLRTTFRKKTIKNLKHKQNHFKISNKIIKKAKVKSLYRPMYKDTLNEIIEIIENDIKK